MRTGQFSVNCRSRFNYLPLSTYYCQFCGRCCVLSQYLFPPRSSLRGRRRKGREGSSASAKREDSEREEIPPADRTSRALLALRTRTPSSLHFLCLPCRLTQEYKWVPVTKCWEGGGREAGNTLSRFMLV